MESLNGKILWQFIFRVLHFVSFFNKPYTAS